MVSSLVVIEDDLGLFKMDIVARQAKASQSLRVGHDDPNAFSPGSGRRRTPIPLSPSVRLSMSARMTTGFFETLENDGLFG